MFYFKVKEIIIWKHGRNMELTLSVSKFTFVTAHKY